MPKEKRFERIYKQGRLDGIYEILLDRKTGVQYLFFAGGLTPLLDAQGNVVITPSYRNPKGPEF